MAGPKLDPIEIAKLEEKLEKAETTPERIDALNALAWMLRFADAERAHKLATEARRLAKAAELVLPQARAARTLAMTIRDRERLPEMLTFAQEAKELFDLTDDLAGKAAARDFLSSLHEHLGDLGSALELALDALTIARQIGDKTRQGYALSSIGGVLTASGEYETAILRLEEALALFEEIGDIVGTGSIVSRLSQVLVRAERGDDALKYAKRGFEEAEKLEDHWFRAESLGVMAQVEYQRKNVHEAIRLYRLAIDSTEQPARDILCPELQASLAKILVEEGQLKEARDELQDALKRVLGDPLCRVTERRVRSQLSEVLEVLGDTAGALSHLRSAHRLHELISEDEAKNRRRQLDIRVAMEAAQKDAEIHRLKYVELQAMQAKLVEADRMALFGKLAAGTAHELNTPLGVLQSNSQIIRNVTDRLHRMARDGGAQHDDIEKAAKVLEQCRQTSAEARERISSLAKNFAKFSQLDQAEQRVYDLHEGLNGALALLTPNTSGQINFVCNFGTLPGIPAWPRELNHAFMTVLQNAVQAIEDSGTIKISTEAGPEGVTVLVEDDGRGMSQEEVATLFEVGWAKQGGRTKMRLGMLAANSTMAKHGGRMSVQSSPGRGTVIRFDFPLSA